MSADRITVDLPGATALFTTRHGGVSAGPYESLNLGLWTDDDPAAVAENRARVAAWAGDAAPAQAHQVHGTEVRVVREAPDRDAPREALPDADGHATALEGVAPMVLVADCLPVALAAPGAVGMVHAGWRGLAGGVVDAGVQAVRGLAGRGEIHAAIGPGAGPCCYEVGDEVRERFAGVAGAVRGRHLDLKAVAAARLRGAGVARVHDVGLCTMCAPQRFFSHRRSGGVTGRQGGLVWLS